MKQSIKDKGKGTLHEVKGSVKEKVGRVTNNPRLAAEGQVEKIRGKVQKKSAKWRNSSKPNRSASARRGRSRFT